MREVSIIGIGQTDVAEHWDKSLKHLAYDAIKAAVADAGIEDKDIGALYVGNMIAGRSVTNCTWALRSQIFAATGDRSLYRRSGLCIRCAALRSGIMAVASGAHDIVVVCGVEK